MIVYFMQKWPDGLPTFFKEKIFISLKDKEDHVHYDYIFCKERGDCSPILFPAKKHTMRESFRIKQGMMLDLAYWSGKPYNSSPERFVLQIPCINTQTVEIIWENKSKYVYIDGRKLIGDELNKLAINDGFDSVEKFFEHFNKTMTYNLIHWTDLKY